MIVCFNTTSGKMAIRGFDIASISQEDEVIKVWLFGSVEKGHLYSINAIGDYDDIVRQWSKSLTSW